MEFSWDVNVIYPFLFIILTMILTLYLMKIKKIKKDGIFLSQQFFFWTSIYSCIKLNDQYTVIYFMNNKESLPFILFLTAGFYSIFLYIPANIFTNKLRSRKSWIFLSHLFIIPVILIFISFPSIITAVFLAIATGMAAASTSTSYLLYSESYQNRVFPFTTMCLIYGVILLANLFSDNITNILASFCHFNPESKNYNTPYVISNTVIVIIIFMVSFFLLLFVNEEKNMFGYCSIQSEKFEPFIWMKGIVIYIFLFSIATIEQIGHGLLFNWLLEQNTWNQYRDKNPINYFSRAATEIYYISQILSTILVSIFLIRRIGVKYTFGLGLLLEFLYFSMMSFTSEPYLFLLLDFISGMGYILILMPLISLTLMWQTRTPRKRIFPIFSTILMFTNSFSQYIIKILSATKIGIFKYKDFNVNYVPNHSVTLALNSQTTIIFTMLAVITLTLLIMFYYSSEFILGEYKNYIYYVNKMREIIFEKIKNKNLK